MIILIILPYPSPKSPIKMAMKTRKYVKSTIRVTLKRTLLLMHNLRSVFLLDPLIIAIQFQIRRFIPDIALKLPDLPRRQVIDI